MWIALRGLWRTVVVLVVSLVSAGLAFAVTPLRKPAPKLYCRLRKLAFRSWTVSLCWAWNIKVELEGEVPEGAFFLVSNHVGYVDVPVLGRHLDAIFVAKADLSGWPVAGQVIRSGGTIFIDRGRKRDLLRVMNEVDRALADGLAVLLFPEGTSSKGDDLLPFKPSLLQIAAGGDRAVHWATVEYRTEAGEGPPSRHVCWWGEEEFLPHYLRFIALNRVTAVIRFGDQPVLGVDRKQLSETLRENMRRSFQPMP